MFTKRIIRVEALSSQLCRKTERFAELMLKMCKKEASQNGESSQELKRLRSEIAVCGTRLLQFIEDNASLKEPDRSPSEDESTKTQTTDRAKADALSNTTPTICQDTSQLGDNVLAEATRCINSFSDSGIDVTEEEKEDSLQARSSSNMNGVSASSGVAEPLESVQALRETLRRLKRMTDKGVVEFLIRSRDVLQEEIKNQTDIDRDHKLLDLISGVLTHKREADKQMTEIEFNCNKDDPLSVLEKSLCYVLVDKALLNCLLFLDKAILEGKLMDSELGFQYDRASAAGQEVIAEFSQTIDQKRQFVQMQEDVKKKDEVIEKMRCQIRELSSDKRRLENENKNLEEQSHVWMLKSEELTMQNTIIDEERQLLKEKVCVLDESMAELQSCTQHLRQQLQTLESQDEESRNQTTLLRERLQTLMEQKQYEESTKNGDKTSNSKGASLSSEPPTHSPVISREETSDVLSVNSHVPHLPNGENNIGNKAIERYANSEEYLSPDSGIYENVRTSPEVKLTETIEKMTRDNKELRNKVKSVENVNNELRAQLKTLKRTNNETFAMRNEELDVAKQQSRTLEYDLEESKAETVLLRAQVLELEKTIDIAKEKMQAMEREICAKSPGQGNPPENACILPKHSETKEDNDQQEGVDEICGSVASLRKRVLSWNRVLREKEELIKCLNERILESDHRVQEMTALLGDLAKRKEILVTKLEMIGAITVVRNDFDVPDGYHEAVDGLLRFQSSMIEKGVLKMVEQVEGKEGERKQLEEQQKRLKYDVEALETENVLLKVQVGDLNQSVEELEEDLINIKCGNRSNLKSGKRPSTPRSPGGHRVTFDSDVDSDKRESENLQSLIQSAKERCINLERQIRSNTSILKATQRRNEVLARERDELQKQNCHLRSYLADFHQTNEALSAKVSELEDGLKDVDERKSLHQMEKQSLEDRLKIMEGHTKYLKDEKEKLSKLVEVLQRQGKQPDEMLLTTVNQCQGLETKYGIIEKETDEVFNRKTDLGTKIERLKNKVKQQAADSRILKCEVLEFLDDVRCLECELNSALDNVQSTEELRTALVGSNFETKTVSTWRDEVSLCHREGLAPIMAEILDLLKATIQRLCGISGKNSTPLREAGVDLVDAKDETTEHQAVLNQQLREETAKLRTEKQHVQREVFAMKSVFENLLDQTDSLEAANKVREEERCRNLRNQTLSYMERNSRMEGEILSHWKQQLALEDELTSLKENILNLEIEKEVLLSLNDGVNSHCGPEKYCKPDEKVIRHFCFVKQPGNGFVAHEVFGAHSENDNEDVFSCPSDEGVCHSPDREAGSCDSGYHEGHSVVSGEKGDPGYHSRYLPNAALPGRSFLESFDESTGRENKRDEVASMSISDKKPKGILKKRSTEHDLTPPVHERESVYSIEADGPGCKVCNFTGLFRPFKRTNLGHQDLDE